MDGLEMPEIRSCFRVNRYESVAIEAIAYPGGAVAIISRRPKRQICDSAFVIDRDHIPRVDAGAVFPTIALPSAKILVPRFRDGIEFPQRLTSDDIDAAHVAARAVGRAFLPP